MNFRNFISMLFLLAPMLANAQKKNNPWILNELQLWGNYPLNDNHTIPKLGFGIGVNRSIPLVRNLDLVVGLKFNQTRKSLMDQSDEFLTIHNASIGIHSISLPIGFRFVFVSTEKVSYFLKASVFMDRVLSVKGRGHYTRYLGNATSQEYVDAEFYLARNDWSFGYATGMGCLLKYDHFDLMVTTEFRAGINDYVSTGGWFHLANRYFLVSMGIRKPLFRITKPQK